MKLRFLSLAFAAVCLFSCSTPRHITYFEDSESADSLLSVSPKPIRLKPDDKISIIVNCQDGKVANLFNLPYVSRYLGQVGDAISSYSQGVSGYTIQADGTIDFPLLGKLSIAGLTREEVAARIKDELVGQSLVKDPVVTVEYMNLCFSVLGEVTRPGRYSMSQDCLTLLEALAQAGDLTIYGRRDNILVLRSENGQQRSYRVSLGDVKAMAASPVYFLQQNDLVYVEPNDVRQRQSTVNGNNIRSTSFWISLASLATSVTLMIFNLTR
ncbi:MAG: polysaccharide biosynthesis/export family protein [Bacteroidales bacterium]|nr:polysaccharide biosynthesis/export family protein [Bacteroidales bacterium]